MNKSGQAPAAPAGAIRVLLVEDTPVARELLLHLLHGDRRFAIAGVASDGLEGVAAAQQLRPDVILMDIHMPNLDGFTAARRIMETAPTRIIMVTASTNPSDVAATFHTLEAGALAVLAKPPGLGSPDFAAATAELLDTIALMAEIPVVRRWPKAAAAPESAPLALAVRAGAIAVIAIGASTGGPPTLQQILGRLPGNLAAPLLIVQHISAGFTEGFAEWLTQVTGFRVQVAKHGESARPAIAYVAPSGRQMGLRRDGVIELIDAPAEYGVLPSASFLFRSLVAFGPAAVGVLLTGMGRDGAQELRALREAGAVTIAQDAESSIVFGMPGEAIRLKAASHVLGPPAIAATLALLASRIHS